MGVGTGTASAESWYVAFRSCFHPCPVFAFVPTRLHVRWSLMILLDNKLFCCLLPVHKSLVERCLVSLLKLIFFPPFPRGRHVYFSINLLIRLQNEDGVTTLRISGPSFVLLRGDINSVGCVVGILICPAPCYGCSRDSLGGKCILWEL